MLMKTLPTEQPEGNHRKLSGLAACGYDGAKFTISGLIVHVSTLARFPVSILIIRSVS